MNICSFFGAIPPISIPPLMCPDLIFPHHPFATPPPYPPCKVIAMLNGKTKKTCRMDRHVFIATYRGLQVARILSNNFYTTMPLNRSSITHSDKVPEVGTRRYFVTLGIPKIILTGDVFHMIDP